MRPQVCAIYHEHYHSFHSFRPDYSGSWFISTRCSRRVSLIKRDVVFLTQCGVFCGGIHQKSKSPQILVVIRVVIWTCGEVTTHITTSICGDLVEIGQRSGGTMRTPKTCSITCIHCIECFYEEWRYIFRTQRIQNSRQRTTQETYKREQTT